MKRLFNPNGRIYLSRVYINYVVLRRVLIGSDLISVMSLSGLRDLWVCASNRKRKRSTCFGETPGMVDARYLVIHGISLSMFALLLNNPEDGSLHPQVE